MSEFNALWKDQNNPECTEIVIFRMLDTIQYTEEEKELDLHFRATWPHRNHYVAAQATSTTNQTQNLALLCPCLCFLAFEISSF